VVDMTSQNVSSSMSSILIIPHLFYYLTIVIMTEQEKKELKQYEYNLLVETIEMKEKRLEELKLLLNYIS